MCRSCVRSVDGRKLTFIPDFSTEGVKILPIEWGPSPLEGMFQYVDLRDFILGMYGVDHDRYFLDKDGRPRSN